VCIFLTPEPKATSENGQPIGEIPGRNGVGAVHEDLVDQILETARCTEVRAKPVACLPVVFLALGGVEAVLHVLGQWRGVGETLQCGIHEACVAEVVQPCAHPIPPLHGPVAARASNDFQ
jgi:hypothetical protein